MKARSILFVALLSGTVLGLGFTWADYGHSPSRLTPFEAGLPGIGQSGELPNLEVPVREYDFGTIERTGTAEHSFVFTNHGPGTLKLTAGTTTCGACTIAALDRDELPPGESTRVTVEYKAGGPKSSFRQTATVLTNDPRQSRVELTISGSVSQKFAIWPDPIDFGNVPAGDTAQAKAQFLYYLKGRAKILEHHFERADTASQFDLEITPLTPEQAERDEAASGYALVLSLKPGLPLGTFHQTIRLTIETEPDAQKPDAQNDDARVSVTGTIVSDLSIVGSGWRNDLGVLSFGTIRSNEGATRKLTLLVRGANRGSVEIEAGRADPPQVQVRMGERTPLNDSIDQIPLEIEIPAGLPPMIRLGTDQGAFGEIELKVKNHPNLSAFPLKLKFAIQ